MDIQVITAIAATAAALFAVMACVIATRALAGAAKGEDAQRRGEQAWADATEKLVDMGRAVEQSLLTVQATRSQVASSAIVEQQHFEACSRAIEQLGSRVDENRRETFQQLERNRDVVDVRLEEMRKIVDVQLGAMRADNERKLEMIRETVDEKLTATLNDRLGASFKQVSDQLEAVYRGLGDMQNIAAGVGDLKRVLSNVKTRGMLGEVQLGAILQDILMSDQYAVNVATKPGSSERVEYAVKLPVEEGDPIWLPIDAKFPGDTYARLRDAVEAGDAEGVLAARKSLEQVIKLEARDISSKYLSVPATTNFAIMFLPFEGLYAEVVDRPGLIECLQRDYQVNVAGPSTMAVILNSLQMSYQTFAFQRRADEIQRVLSAVKSEFPKYQAELRRALKQIETAGKTVDGIINTRTNVIERKLRNVTALEDGVAAEELLGIGQPASEDGEEEVE